MAGVDVGTAYLTVVPSAKGFAGKLSAEVGGGMSAAGRKAGSDAASGFGSTFKSGVGTAAKAGALALVAAGVGAIAFARDAVAEARESQKVGAITEQIIKSTGGAAKVSAGQVGDLATAISNKTGVDDEAIQTGANMLLTFKNVRNEAGKGAAIFDRATQAAADLSAAGFGDMKGASLQLGKALNDPIKGIAALGRSGVTFTKDQKEQIKTLVASGKTLDAQKIILKEVESQVGGTAAASATAGEKMATAFGNFKEGIGTALLPTIDKFANFVTDRLLPGVQGVIDILFKGDFTKGFAEAFNLQEDSGIVDFLFDVREGFGKVKDIAGQVFDILFRGDFNGGPLSEDSGVVDKLFDLREGFFQAKDAVTKFVEEFKAGEGAGGKFRDALEQIADIAQSVAKWIGENSTFVKQLAVAVLAGVAAFKVITTAVKIYTAVQAALNVVMSMNPIGLVVIAIAALVAGIVLAYQRSETFRKIVKGAFEAIGKAAQFMWNNVVAPVIRFLIKAFASVADFYAALLRGMSKIPGFGWAAGAADKLQKVANKARGIADEIRDIPDRKVINVDIYARTRQTGRIELPNGAKVNVGMREHGGPVAKGQPYIVGEKRPELFVPNQSGTIVPRVPTTGGGLSRADVQALTVAVERAHLSATISAGTVDRSMAVGMR